jgi:hypothetical protein
MGVEIFIKFDLKKPEHILSNFFETNNIDYLLLHPEFERYSKETGKRLHFPYKYEDHWDAKGHAIAAELIYEKLREISYSSSGKSSLHFKASYLSKIGFKRWELQQVELILSARIK